MKDRIHNILSAVQKTYDGKKRSELKDSDFLFPETRSFPIVTPQDIADAISNFGRMKGSMSYDAFLKKLYNMAKRKGSSFVAAFPEASKKKLGIKTKANKMFNIGDKVVNVNPDCVHYGSKGKVCGLEKLPNEMGQVVAYETYNSGETWKVGDVLKKTPDQLTYDNFEGQWDATISLEDEEDEMELENESENENEDEDEMMEYKQDFYEMSVGSLRAIAKHSQDILNSLDNPNVKENLTESWLQGKIAITEDYMRTIHDFIMYVTEAADNVSAADKPGLWDNIRKKKERMGKNYKPAKPGDKDRPDPEQWKKLSK